MTLQISFVDGAAYERYMGRWSQLVGRVFLDWLPYQTGWRWLDIGCGNGAFTEMIVEHAAPESVAGIDPSEEQLAYAQRRAKSDRVAFRKGDAMELPYPADSFDAAVMPLVIFFVPDPPKGVAEMVRVVRAGGIVSAYAWDMDGGGFPYAALHEEMSDLGIEVPKAPSPAASRAEVMRDLWEASGLGSVETREITVERGFGHFDDYWTTALGGPSVGRQLAALNTDETAVLKGRMRERLGIEGNAPVALRARANAIIGYVRP